MKNKIISTIMLIALICAAIIGEFNTSVEVFAAGTSKTAALSTVNVSLDGKAAAAVQSYKIDGSNYVRATEIGKLLNIKATNSTTAGKTLLNPEKAYESGNTAKLTAASINVTLNDGSIAYAGNISSMQCFAYSGENFYKISDIITASENALAHERDWVETHAPVQSYDERYMGTKSIKTYKLEWDSATSTAKISTITTDLQAYLRSIRNGAKFEMNEPQTAIVPTAEMVQQPNCTDKTLPPVTSKVEPQPELTAPPEVGSQPANILINTSKGAYSSDGKANTDNLTDPYKSNNADYVGQCTWYAVSRFYEVTGVYINSALSNGNSFRKLDSAYKDLSKWAEIAKNNAFDSFTGITDTKNIQPRSIAVWDNHVLFVEYVEKNADGSPAYVYFTEGNTGHDGVYRADKDGKVQKMSFDKFLNRDNRSPLRGYIVAK